jgi:hypothetical protein
MPDQKYEALDAGERWGCGVAGLVGAASLVFLLSLDALGDCAPDSGCSKGFWTNVLLPTVAITAIAFFMVRALVNNDRK